jgi:hypothetical protein
MDVRLRLFSFYVVLCVGGSLATGWSPSKKSYRLCIGLRNWKCGEGQTKGWTAIARWMDGKIKYCPSGFFSTKVYESADALNRSGPVSYIRCANSDRVKIQFFYIPSFCETIPLEVYNACCYHSMHKAIRILHHSGK